MSEITTVGVDLAKEVIAVCAADRSGKTVFTRMFRRDAFAAWAVQLPCLFGLEACGAAHHWARWLTSHGHTPRLMAAEFVRPFRKSRAAKNDRNDAEAVLTAVRQPNMRFVAVKSIEQQACLSWHWMRQGWSEERTALINRLRGLLGEFGIWRGRSAAVLNRALAVLEHDEGLPLMVRRLLAEARPHLARLDEAIARCEAEIKISKMGANLLRGKGWSRARTARAARRGWVESLNGAIATCVACSPKERARRCRRHSTKNRYCAPACNAGSCNCTPAWATTRPWWLSPTSTRG